MKFLISWPAVICLAFTVPSPAFAATAPADTAAHGGCFDHYAEWRRDDDGAPVPPGTWTTIQTCTIAGHQIRINSAYWPTETYHCGGAGPRGSVSAWVDGVKVVDNREYGLGALCFEQDTRLITKIIVNDKLHLTVCEALGASERDTPYTPSELKAGQNNVAITDDEDPDENQDYFIEQCTLTTVSPPSGATDAYFSLRTPPGIALIDGGDAICPSVQAAFTTPQNSDELGPYATTLPSVLDAYRTDSVTLDGKPFATASDEDKAAGEITHYRLDVDNDGVADTLTFADKTDDSGMDYPGQYSWTSGKTGQNFAITGEVLNTHVGWMTDLYPDPVRDSLTFVAAGGRIYLYRTVVGLLSSFPDADVTEFERMTGAVEGGSAVADGSRWLYELRPDGTARVACQWHARKRPEEFV